MRIDPEDRIAGHPVLSVRDLLRQRVFRLDAVRKILKVDEKEAERVVETLKKERYICHLFGDNPPPDVWQTTPDGSRLGQAHARPSITRDEADRIMEEFMNRVAFLRDNDKFLYEVRRVTLFGSYLGDKDELNDIDLIVSYRIKPKFKNNFRDLLRDRLEAAAATGLTLKRNVDWSRYPRQGAVRVLRGVSRYISFHRENELTVIEDACVRMGWSDPVPPHKVIYEADA